MNSNENNDPRINAAKAQQNGIEQTGVFSPSAGQQQASFGRGKGQTLNNSATYAAHGQWAAVGPATEGYTVTAARPSDNAAAAQPKTKKQLIALTCALSLVCGIFGGVVGGGLSNAAGSSQAGSGQTAMQQPGGQGSTSNGASGGAAASGSAGNAQGGPSNSTTGNAPSAPRGDAGSSNSGTSGSSTSGSSASGDSASNSSSTQSNDASASKGANVSVTETSSQTI